MIGMRVRAIGVWAALLLAAGTACSAPLPARVLDDFNDASAWKASASDDVTAHLRRDGARGLCLDYDFHGVSGYAVLHRALPLDLPANYAFDLRLRGQGPPNDFQFKLVDASGDNVWWINRPSFGFTRSASELTVKKRHISFAWGPAADHALGHVAAIEFVVVARAGGRGSACFERLALRTLDVPAADAPARVLTDLQRIGAGPAVVTLDFPATREFNGLWLRWRAGLHATDYDIDAADGAGRWRTLRRVRGGDGGTDALYLPESEASRLRMRLLRGPGRGYAIDALDLCSAEQWPDANAMWRSIAASEPRGHHPRAFHDQQNYWTLVGVDGGGAHAALLSEDGAVEPARGGPSIEPFVQMDDGALVAWSDVQITNHLREGYLPMPTVHWTHAAVGLDVQTAAIGTRVSSQLLARYTLSNPGAQPRRLALVLALRPWQVNPPQQFLTTPGGASGVRTLQWRAGALHVNERAMARPLQHPDAVIARTFDSGSVLSAIAPRGKPPMLSSLVDPNAMASAALVFRFDVPAHGSRQVDVLFPLAGTPDVPAHADPAWADSQFEQAAAQWRERLNRVALDLPEAGRPLHDSLRSALAHILMSRDGVALQPGTRSYARTWIRDGAMMVAALLRMGEVPAAREFVEWYAGMLFANGKVPCCVDARGPDPVVENDSAGEFIFAVAELWRHARDRATLERLWPKVESATRYMEALRQSERTPANRDGERASWWGLMPASISHEGYSAKPMHSYWDDFWALRGYKDAVQLATVLGRTDDAARIARWRDEFEHDLVASIRTSSAQHRIDTIGGAAELGDFDPTSTTIALSVAQAEDRLPADLLHNTFERYWRESVARRDGQREWVDYTPYELRSVGAFVRLGQPERAHAMLGFFFGDQRPRGWNQWAEVVMREPRQVHFLGDMPHAWISSDFIRSALDMLAFERDSDQALVLAAGVPPEWLAHGVTVKGLSTSHGPLGYRLRQLGNTVQLDVDGGLAVPEGGVVLAWPGTGTLPRAALDGEPVDWTARELRIRRLPAHLTLATAP